MTDMYQDYGWQLCEQDGEAWECDTCEKECNPTYYRRTSFEYDEGEYSCAECIDKEIASYAEMEKDYYF